MAGLRQLRAWTVGTLVATTVVAGGACIASVLEYRSLHGIAHRAYAPAVRTGSFGTWHDVASALGTTVLVLVVVGAALFLPWMWRARAVVADLRHDGVTAGDAWVTIGWLPVVNLVVPYTIAQELYNASDPRTDPRAPVEHRHAWWLVVFWWAPTALLGLVTLVRIRVVAAAPMRLVAPSLHNATVGTVTASLVGSVFVLGAIAFAAFGATLLVRRVTARLEACVEHPAAATNAAVSR